VKSFRASKAAGRCAIWDTPGSGDPMVPFNDPVGNLTVIRFCSDFNYYAAASGFPLDTTISHASIAADAGTTIGFVTAYNSITTTDWTLANISLGYVPNVMVSVAGIQIPAGYPVQVGSGGARRCVSVYADTTKIWLRESARPSIPGLAAISLVYHIMVFRDPASVGGAPLFRAQLNSTPTRVQMGYGRIDSNEKTLREANIGDTLFGLPSGVTMDILNGRAKFALPDGTQRIIGPISGTAAYSGSFIGGPSKQVTI
jgi:hypothetical protein